MMTWAGSVVGFLCGLANAVYVYRVAAGHVPTGAEPDRARGLYFALWAFGLWLLAGSYVLVLWLLAMLFYVIFKVFR